MNHKAALLAYALGTLGPSAVRSLLPRSFALDGERIVLSSPAAMIVWDGKINPSLPFARKAVELFFRACGDRGREIRDAMDQEGSVSKRTESIQWGDAL